MRELEETPGVDLDRLVQALETVKMARLAAMGRRRRRPADACSSFKTLDASARATLLEDLRAAGVRVERAPPGRRLRISSRATQPPAASPRGAGPASARSATAITRGCCSGSEIQSRRSNPVMAGLVPAIHIFFAVRVCDCGDGVQWPKERKPMCFMGVVR